MGLFFTSEDEKKALEIEQKLSYIRDAYPLYDEKAIPYLEKWVHKTRPIDKQWTDATERSNTRRINLILIKEMKQAEIDFIEQKDFKKLVAVSIKSEDAFYALQKVLKEQNPILMLDAQLAVTKELPSFVNGQNKNDGDWLAREVADGYAKLGPDYIEKCTDALNVMQKKSHHNHFRAYVERAMQKEKDNDDSAANFMLAALKINSRPHSSWELDPANKARGLLEFTREGTQLALAQGLAKNIQRTDKDLAETFFHSLDQRSIDYLPFPKTENAFSVQALKILIDPKGLDILHKDAAERLGNLTDRENITVKQFFLETVRRGIVAGRGYVVDTVMPDLATLDKFIASYNQEALASEGKMESLSYHNLIPNENKNGDQSRTKLMQMIFDEKVKDQYQAGQSQDQEMQATMVLLGDLAGDIVMNGYFDHDPQKKSAVEMIKKMILLENAHKLEGDALHVMKGNMGDQPASTEMPEFEGEGAKILKLMGANPSLRSHVEEAQKINNELAAHVMTLRQAQSPTIVVKSRYTLDN